MVNFMDKFGENIDIDSLPILALAFVGDSVFDLWVRSKLVREGASKVERLHKRAIRYVSAKGQAEFFEKIMGILTEDELAIFNRGRNSKSAPTKNASPKDYAVATGLEAVLGWLYLNGEKERLEEILKRLPL